MAYVATVGGGMKIYVGTANWGKPYGMNQVKVPHEEIDRILTVADAHDCGIETAWDYGCMGELRSLGVQFPIIFKCDTEEQLESAYQTIGHVRPMKHHPPYDDGHPFYGHSSVYDPKDGSGGLWEFPYNLIDQRFGKHLVVRCNIARSVFIQGLAFKMPDFHGIPFYHLCWNFVRNNPLIDGVVVGVDSAAQLEDILSIPQYEIDYSRIGRDAWYREY
jgi:hypothetical protein